MTGVIRIPICQVTRSRRNRKCALINSPPNSSGHWAMPKSLATGHDNQMIEPLAVAVGADRCQEEGRHGLLAHCRRQRPALRTDLDKGHRSPAASFRALAVSGSTGRDLGNL